jgi:uncharacterized membrane protein
MVGKLTSRLQVIGGIISVAFLVWVLIGGVLIVSQVCACVVPVNATTGQVIPVPPPHFAGWELYGFVYPMMAIGSVVCIFATFVTVREKLRARREEHEYQTRRHVVA